MSDRHRIVPPVRALPVLFLCLAFVVGLAGEATPALGRTAATTLPPAPPLPVKDAEVYHIVPAESQLRIRVWRSGPLAELGHNHVIVTSDIEGRIWLHDRLADSGFELKVPIASLAVDRPQDRAEEGKDFEGELSDGARQGTRRHMLGKKALDAAQYPQISLRSIAVAGPPWYPRITVRISLHGVSRDYVVPTAIVRQSDRLIATGGLRIRQSDFGITPYSVLVGGLRVADTIAVSFHFVAVPDPVGSHQRS